MRAGMGSSTVIPQARGAFGVISITPFPDGGRRSLIQPGSGFNTDGNGGMNQMKTVIKNMVFGTDHGIVISGIHRRLLSLFVVKNESITRGNAVYPSFF